MKKLYRSSAGRKFLLLLAFSWPAVLLAQQFQQQQPDEKELGPVSRTYAITNATVIQAPGRKTEGATVVIRDGLITAVGKNIAVPAEAIVVKGDSLYVYPGFIDGLSHAGVPKPKDERRDRPKDPANPEPEIAGITPQNDVRSALSPEDKAIEELRALGFTTAQVVPYGGMLPGSAAVVLLSGKNTDKMVLAGKTALFSELAGAQRVYPATVIAVMAKWRELYKQAQLAKSYESVYAANRTGLTRPASDRILEAFYPVIDKRMPVIFEADRYLDIQRILALQADLGFSLIAADIKEGWDAIPKLKATNTKVFLSLDLPEDKKEDKKDAGKKSGDAKTEEATTLTPAEKEALEKRKAESLARYTSQAGEFQKAGVTFGFSTLSAKTSDIRANLRRMIAAGLTEDQALGALTTGPAQLLGLSDRLGSIDIGKIANLVLSDKPYFNEKANVRYVFVDGMMYKYDVKPASKKDDAAKTDVAGTWTVTSENAQVKTEETLTIKKEGANYTGSITGTKMPKAVSLESVSLNGNTLKYSYTVQQGGQSYKVDVDATVEGNTFKGTASTPAAGSYTVEGKKSPNH